MHKQHLLHSAHELDVGPRRPLKPGPTASALIEYCGEVQGVRDERHRFVISSIQREPKALGYGYVRRALRLVIATVMPRSTQRTAGA